MYANSPSVPVPAPRTTPYSSDSAESDADPHSHETSRHTPQLWSWYACAPRTASHAGRQTVPSARA